MDFYTVVRRGRTYRLVRSPSYLDHLITTWCSEVFLHQTCSLPQWPEAEVCEEPRQEYTKVAINKNSYRQSRTCGLKENSYMAKWSV